MMIANQEYRLDTEEGWNAFWAWIHDEGIAPNKEKIARAWLDGDIAVLSVDPASACAEVGRMNKTRAARFADLLEKDWPADGAIPWLRRRSGHRLFVIVEEGTHWSSGTYCFDFVPGLGFKTAPRTLEREWMGVA